MKKSWVLIIVLLAVVAFIAVDAYLHVSEKDAADPGKAVFANAAGEIASTAITANTANPLTATNTANTSTAANSTTAAYAADEKAVLVDINNTITSSSAINPQILIQNLDKVTDETINYAYKQSPDNIAVGSMVEGFFTDSGKPELLVIFKLLKMPHAGGLDCSVAAVYDRSTLGIITQKVFQYDECHFNILKDEAQKGYLLFTGSSTYQGYSQYTLGLWKPGKTWTDLSPVKSYAGDNKKSEWKNDGSIWVSRPVYENAETHEITWLHEYNLIWNETTHILEENIPAKYKDEAGNPNVDAVSVSPDGKYAISTQLDKAKVLVYDIKKNALASSFELLAQDYGFMWSPDNSKVCVTKTARVWIDVSFIDVNSMKAADMPTVDKILNTFGKNGIKLNYELNKNRPDPYISPIEWSPDSKRILLFYQWTDSNYIRQNGTFVFEVATGEISRISQNKTEVGQEGGNIPAAKPDGFKW